MYLDKCCGFVWMELIRECAHLAHDYLPLYFPRRNLLHLFDRQRAVHVRCRLDRLMACMVTPNRVFPELNTASCPNSGE